MSGRKKLTNAERVLKYLKKPGSRYKFKHLKELTGLSRRQLEEAISEVRVTHPNLVFAKFDRTFYLAETPTWYSHHTDLSSKMPKEGVFGVVSDTHLGSVAERLDILKIAYQRFAEVGVRQVFHIGDMTDGFSSYRGHHQFVKVFGSQPQAIYVIENYPRQEGITTYAIAGNHDLDSYKYDKVDRLGLVVNGLWHEGKEYKGRRDIIYLGQYSHNVVLPEQVSLHLLHPRGGNTYALSYPQQKRSEAMDRNLRPDVQFSGHFHMFNYCWLNHTHFIACSGMQDETEFFKRRGFSRNVGFLLVWYRVREGKFAYLQPELHMF